MEMSPEEFTRFLDRVVQAIAEMPLVENVDLTADDYLLLKDNSTNQPKKVTITQLGAIVSTTLDADLAAIAALSPSNDDILQRKAGAWTNRTLAQYLIDLAVVRLTTDQTVAGNKTFSGELILTSAGSRFTRSFDAAITAFATGGIASATQLTGMISRITVCATAEDSVKLGAAIAGRSHKVRNDGVATAHIFPNVGQSINGVVDDFMPIPSGGYLEFICVVDGAWRLSSGNIDLVSTFKGSAAVGYGLMKLNSATFEKTFLGGGTETIVTGLPVGTLIQAVQIRNNTSITVSGGINYSSTIDGAGTPIHSAALLTKNTKANGFCNKVCTTDTDITITPDAGTLDGGTITAIVYYFELTSITDAP